MWEVNSTAWWLLLVSYYSMSAALCGESANLRYETWQYCSSWPSHVVVGARKMYFILWPWTRNTLVEESFLWTRDWWKVKDEGGRSISGMLLRKSNECCLRFPFFYRYVILSTVVDVLQSWDDSIEREKWRQVGKRERELSMSSAIYVFKYTLIGSRCRINCIKVNEMDDDRVI